VHDPHYFFLSDFKIIDKQNEIQTLKSPSLFIRDILNPVQQQDIDLLTIRKGIQYANRRRGIHVQDGVVIAERIPEIPRIWIIALGIDLGRMGIEIKVHFLWSLFGHPKNKHFYDELQKFKAAKATCCIKKGALPIQALLFRKQPVWTFAVFPGSPLQSA